MYNYKYKYYAYVINNVLSIVVFGDRYPRMYLQTRIHEYFADTYLCSPPGYANY